ncbi:hypothetical protein CFP56_031584, partial [Quercus suber]
TVAITSRHRFILSFNVNDESFREIMLSPNQLDLDGVPVCWTELAVFKGSLAVFIYTDDHWGVFCHIWVMEEYGVAESWIKKYMVPMILNSHFYGNGCTDNGELLIKTAIGLVSIDPESRSQNILAIEDADWVGYAANSMESLILLDGGKLPLGLVSIDPKSRNQNILAIEDADWVGCTANSMESLILLDGNV